MMSTAPHRSYPSLSRLTLSRLTLSLLAIAALAACAGESREPGGTTLALAAPAGGDSLNAADTASRAAEGAAGAGDGGTVSGPTAGGGTADTTAAQPGPAQAGDVVTIPRPEGRTARDSIALVRAIRAGRQSTGWPVAGPAAAPGAILPARRIVAFYGNPLSKRMGALGEYEVDDMLARLDREVKAWEEADPSTPVVPALHLVTVVAQGAAGRDGKWRLRMDSTLIAKVHGWAKSRNGLLFLDVQTGWSTIQEELPRLRPWLEQPDIHFGMDPEFNMHGNREGVAPGKKIGTYDAKDINFAVRTLAEISRSKGIPPKVLVVHRFTQQMVTNASSIRLDPNVQVVMDMDGWGPPWLKFDSYRSYVVNEPVQFTGFKLFFHNDTKKGDPLLTPRELVLLVPAPHYIQYQ